MHGSEHRRILRRIWSPGYARGLGWDELAACIRGEFPEVLDDSVDVPTLAWLGERSALARTIPILPNKKATVPVPTIVQGEFVGVLVETPIFDQAEARRRLYALAADQIDLYGTPNVGVRAKNTWSRRQIAQA